jgi:ELWxxDGT repeat protein
VSRLCYAAINASGDYVLDVTDGTTAGTDDILTPTQNFGPQSPYGFTALDDDILFAAADPSGFVGLWVTEGTDAGAVELVSSKQGSALLSPEQLTTVGGYVMFEARDINNDEALWSTTGDEGSAAILLEFDEPRYSLTSLGHFAFAADSSGFGSTQLWVTEGTAASTYLVDSNASPSDFDDDFAIAKLGSLGLFQAVDGTGARGVYSVDPSTGAAQELLGGMQGFFALDPSDFIVAGDLAFFSAVDSTGQRGLWVTNGTTSGTAEIFGNTSNSEPLDPDDITAIGDDVVFEGQDSGGAISLYWSNGKGAGTHEVVSGVPGETAVSPDFTALGSLALFDAPDANDDGAIGLWVTDGAVSDALEVAPGAQGVYSLRPSDFVVVGGEVYFEATDSTGKVGVWVTNGTAAVRSNCFRACKVLMPWYRPA